MSQPLTLIFTNSYDLTVNRLIQRLGSERVFRFNFDIWREYRLSVTPDDFRLANPTGREIRRADVAKFLWRKPISRFQLPGHQSPPSGLARLFGRRRRTGFSAEERYVEEEMLYATREIKNLLWRDGKLVLIEPAAYMRLGKFVQMEAGARYFAVPPWEFSFDATKPRRGESRRIVKSLTSERVADNTFMWTTVIEERSLDPGTPWFVQDLVEATLDVTVVHVRGKLFGFALDRASLAGETVDWREVGERTTPLWAPHELPKSLGQAIRAFMKEVSLDYGRLDFLYDGETYWFLEVNANGEWDWLDADGKGGLLDLMVREIDPATPVHTIPRRPQGSR